MPHRVLLVDDEPNVLEALKRALHREPYEVLCATSGPDALMILHSHAVDVVISDQEMPGMRGTEFLSMVRQRFPNTVRFVLTGKATLDVAMKAINDGAVSRFFIKPCNLCDLMTTIRQSLQQRDLMVQALRLLETVRNQAEIIERMERAVPGVTQVKRDADGAVILDDVPSDFEAFMAEINREVTRANERLGLEA
jgi:two-component system probable response regulator PhcQ